MTGAELKALQTRYGWTNAELAGVLNPALDRHYNGDLITKWRSGRAKVPARVEAFLVGLDDPPALSAEHGPAAEPAVPPPGEEDTPPTGTAGGARPSLTLVAGGPGSYSRVCEEFFELIATAVGMIGAAIGSDSVRYDGRIILEDKQALGQAWGKLAEQNETFARLLVATDKQGAYLAVALATGTTAGRIWQNHQPPSPPTLTAVPGEHDAGTGADQPPPAV